MTRLARMGHRLSESFGLNRMSREFKLFANTYFNFVAATTLSNIFISTFLFKSGGEMGTIARYYFLFYLLEMTGIYLVVRLSHRVSNVAFTVIGLFLHAAAYSLLIIAREDAIRIYPAIAVVCGLGSGFYWVSYHSLLQVYTTVKNRQFGMAFSGMVVNIITLVAPTVAGAVITWIPGTPGYVAVFCVAFLFFACAVLIMVRLKGTAPEAKRRTLLPLIRRMYHEKVLNYSMLGEFLRGLRDGVYAFYLNILIFSMTSNELVLGLTTTCKGAAAILIFYLLGRRNLDGPARVRLMLAAALLSLCVTGSLFFWYSAAAVIVYSVLDNGAQLVINNYANYIGYNIASYASRKCGDCRMENAALRLISLELGRTAGIFVSFLIPAGNNRAILTFFMVLCGVNLLAWAVYRRAENRCRAAEEVDAHAG